MEQNKKKFSMPSAYTILFAIIVVVAILTWIVPAGQYEMTELNGKEVPVPGTYQQVERTPQGISDIITSPVKGYQDAVDVALFILIIGGFLGVVMKTGAIDAGIAQLTNKLKGKEKIMIPILMVLFGVGGTSFGMAEEADAIENAVSRVLDKGLRTADNMSNGCTCLGCTAMGDAILAEL